MTDQTTVVLGTVTASAEHRGIGPYNAMLRLYGSNSLPDAAAEADIPVDQIPHLIRALTQAYENLTQRRTIDALAGDCATCKNIRMVTVEKHGRGVREHCPTCQKPVQAALTALNAGTLPSARFVATEAQA